MANLKTKQIFELANAPLEGTHLIEAGAGTGKTHSIASIFLRLILEKSFKVDDILVLTYTKAATLELKERIRAVLAAARNAATDTHAVFLLDNALADFDNADIYNFHGFCQKVLKDYAVETGGLFDAEIMPDNSAILETAVDDFWRNAVYHAKPVLAGYLADKLETKTLRNSVKTIFSLNTPMAEMPLPNKKDYAEERLVNTVKAMEDLFGSIKNQWLLYKDEIMTALNAGADGYKHNSYKEEDRKIMQAEMEAYTKGLILYPLPKDYANWAAEVINDKTKAKFAVPTHNFFNLWQQMKDVYASFEEEAQKLIFNLKIDAVDYVKSEMQTQKRLQNKLDFDDLIFMVGQAVLKGDAGLLKNLLRNKYKAVMVDEFQDTDPLQYKMFSELFANSWHLFFMIGDPKQAIYGFRGADVFSYFAAAKQTPSAYTLNINWRSSPRLVTAVNTIFQQRAQPFVVAESAISFEPAKAAPQDQNHNGHNEDTPLTLWYIDSEKLGKPVTNKKTGTRFELTGGRAEDLVAKATALEILRLLQKANPPLNPKDIAVLVNDNRQAGLVFKKLAQLNVPSTINDNTGIYNTDEARELQLILESASDPEDLAKLKAAYTTKILGGLAAEYLNDDSTEKLWGIRVQHMRNWRKTYADKGFLAMFFDMVFAENSFGRLLTNPSGRRQVTNFVHLAELLHTKAVDTNLAPLGLARFLAKAIRQKQETEETSLRIETDSDVVQIVTVHKSKGLEYAVVFYPFGWEGVTHSDKNGGAFKYHAGNLTRFDFFNKDNTAEGYETYLKEALAEKMRLLYVALTRAKRKVYIGFGKVNPGTSRGKFETSPLGYLLQTQALDANDPKFVTHMQNALKSKEIDDAAIRVNLAKLVKASGGTIAVVDLPQQSLPDQGYAISKSRANSLRKLARYLYSNWRVTSFSGLTQIAAGINEEMGDSFIEDSLDGKDIDQGLNQDVVDADLLADVAEPRLDVFTIFDMEKSAHTGNFFHDLLETIDFATAAKNPPQEIIAAKLAEYGINELFDTAVSKLLRNLLNAKLVTKAQDIVKLSQVEHVLKEMEFYFPLAPVTQEALSAIFGVNFTFNAAQGFLKGFIDLTFENNGKFYVLDWKSNYLGPKPSDYNQANMQASVDHHSYSLQYHLYVLALCQYLRLKLSNFSYKKDFGGVFYIFLRGFGEDSSGQFGAFSETPSLERINQLGTLLITDFVEFI